jgi:GNAT superfamily N-acetyltransferase
LQKEGSVMDRQIATDEFVIQAFDWEHWAQFWHVHDVALAENGIEVGFSFVYSRTSEEDARTAMGYGEDDLYYVDACYLHGGGGFWLAWVGAEAVGSVGAQDLGGVAELRRMYVLPGFRRRGIGARLVEALINHCSRNGIRAIELWTAEDGPGRFLYSKLGFWIVSGKGQGFEPAKDNPDEIRMRLEL